MKENRILLTEQTFTELCKLGYVAYKTSYFNRIEISITREDMMNLIEGKIIEKNEYSGKFLLALQDIGHDRIYAILKRSPIYNTIS